MPFLIQIAPSRVTHERNIIFARTPCKVFTNWHWKLPLINSLLSSLSLLETDYKCDDYGRDFGYCKHCSESAFDKSNEEQMSEMSSKEYPVRLKKNHGKDGGKLPPPAAKNNGKRN